MRTMTIATLLALTLAGCGDSTPAADGPKDETVADLLDRKVDRPNASERVRLEKRLVTIDQRMSARPDRFVRWAEYSCSDMLNGNLKGARLEKRVRDRFTGGTLPDFSAKQARQVIRAVRDFCG